MNRELQNQLQDKIADTINREKNLIVFVSMRVGKTRAALKSINENESTLVVYPNKDIKTSWLNELEKFTPKSTNIKFVTKASVHKYANTSWDNLFLDELPMMQSEKQLNAIKTIKYKKRVGLTGAMNSKTERNLRDVLGITVKFKYSVRSAIQDGLIKDYKIFVHFVKLRHDLPTIVKKYGKEQIDTEANVYEFYSEQMNNAEENKNFAIETMNLNEYHKWDNIFNSYMSLRTNFLYNSETLYSESCKFLAKLKNKKVLIYTMRTDIADALSDESYHSKNNDVEILNNFKSSNTGHLAVCNSISAGVTIENLNTVFFHTYDSNTETLYQKLARSLLYDYNTEYSEIHLMCLQDTQMELWMDKACEQLEQDKIYFVFNDSVVSKIDYYKSLYPNLELYLYKGNFVYYSHQEQNGIWLNNMYKFINSDKCYALPQKDLIKI